jgi:WD40 repeat protein
MFRCEFFSPYGSDPLFFNKKKHMLLFSFLFNVSIHHEFINHYFLYSIFFLLFIIKIKIAFISFSSLQGIRAMVAPPQGNVVVTGGSDRSIRVWDMVQPELSFVLGEQHANAGAHDSLLIVIFPFCVLRRSKMCEVRESVCD